MAHVQTVNQALPSWAYKSLLHSILFLQLLLAEWLSFRTSNLSACKSPKWAINLLSGWCFLSLHDPLKPWPASRTSLHSSVLKSWLLVPLWCSWVFWGDLASSLRGWPFLSPGMYITRKGYTSAPNSQNSFGEICDTVIRYSLWVKAELYENVSPGRICRSFEPFLSCPRYRYWSNWALDWGPTLKVLRIFTYSSWHDNHNCSLITCSWVAATISPSCAVTSSAASTAAPCRGSGWPCKSLRSSAGLRC